MWGWVGRRGRLLLATGGAITVAIGFGAADAAAITVSNVQALPANNAAGANSDLVLSFDLAGGKLKDLTIHLPPGLVGNPLATTTCTEAQLNASACPAASKVGTITNDVQIGAAPAIPTSGDVFNVVPRAGEPARFGFVLPVPLGTPIILQSPAMLRPTDFGLDTVLTDVPDTATILGVPTPITITGVALNLQGRIGGEGFLRNPTSCGTHIVGVDATAHDASTGSAAGTFTTTGCQSLPFDPQFSARITQGNPKQPVGVSTTISQTATEAGLKRATVTLPAELGPNGTAFANTCAEADFQAGNCPEATIVGSAKAASPLQSKALEGPVILITTPPGSLPKLGLDLRGALALKLIGAISLDTSNPAAFRNQVTFDGLPDIPISEFTLTFAGGPGGLNLATRNPCAPPPFRFDTDFLSHGDVTRSGTTEAEASCRGSKPKAKARLKVPRSGVYPILKLKLKAGALAPIRKATVNLPPQITLAKGAKLKRGLDATGARVKASRSKLKLNAKKRGAERIRVVLGDGAFALKGRRLRGKIRLDVRATDGQRTKLAVKAK